jgi:hypothetical protein
MTRKSEAERVLRCAKERRLNIADSFPMGRGYEFVDSLLCLSPQHIEFLYSSSEATIVLYKILSDEMKEIFMEKMMKVIDVLSSYNLFSRMIEYLRKDCPMKDMEIALQFMRELTARHFKYSFDLISENAEKYRTIFLLFSDMIDELVHVPRKLGVDEEKHFITETGVAILDLLLPLYKEC